MSKLRVNVRSHVEKIIRGPVILDVSQTLNTQTCSDGLDKE